MRPFRRLTAALAILGALSAPALAQSGEPITIGVALSQTGNLADSAAHYRRAIELWRDQKNAAGGLLGRPVALQMYDDRSDPATAARLYERLITSDNVDLLLSPFGSAGTAAATPVAEKHGRVIINAGGASEAIQQRGFKNVFQTAARISSYVDGVVPMAKANGYKSMVFIARDYSAARDMEKALSAQAEEAGIELQAVEYFPAGTADFSSYIARARDTKPDMWISVGYPNEAIEMVRQMRATNYLPPYFLHNGVSQEDFLEAAGQDGEYALGMSLYEPSLDTKGNKEFVTTFNEAYGYEPGYYAAFGWAGVNVLSEAVEKVGSLDQDKLRETLKTMETQTAFGNYKVDPETGMQIGIKGLIVQVQSGKRQIVWPDDVATAKPVLPMPQWSERD